MDLLQRKKQAAPAGAEPAAPAAPAATPEAPAAPQPRGSGFVGFDRYFEANRPGAQAMAQKVGDTVQERAQTGAGAIQGAHDTFAAKSQAANLGYDPTKAQTSDQARALAATTYTGPKDWGDAGVNTSDVADKVNKGQAAVAQLQTTGGIASLLKESYNTQGYTAGALGLDAALAGSAGGDRFSQLSTAYGDLGQRLVDARKLAGTTYDANLASTKDAATKYGELVPGLQHQEAEAAKWAEWQRIAQEQERARQDARNRETQAPAEDGQWTQEEADRLDDVRRGGASRSNRRRAGGN